MRRQPIWARRRAADRPTKSKKRDHDVTNELAAGIILADIAKHSDFQVRWAKAFRQRKAEELDAC